jgi:hypothetical protein
MSLLKQYDYIAPASAVLSVLHLSDDLAQLFASMQVAEAILHIN